MYLYSASRLCAIRGVETRSVASLHLFFEHVCDSNENRLQFIQMQFPQREFFIAHADLNRT